MKNLSNPPQFHVKYGGFEAQIDIKTGGIIKGKFPPKACSMIMEWTMLHQTELLQNRDIARQYGELINIIPLE